MSDAPATKKRRTPRTAAETPAAPKRERSAAPKAPRATTKRAQRAAPADPSAVPYTLIAERAYERFAARGYVHGHDLEDWVLAERELADAAPA